MTGLTDTEQQTLNRAQFLTPPTLEDNPIHQAVEAIVDARVQAERDRLLDRIEAMPTHNDVLVCAGDLEYAARHPALCGSWTFDVLVGLAAILNEERGW